MIRTPKDRFMAGAHKEPWKKMVQSETFEEASMAALMALVAEQTPNPTPNQAADAQNRLLGAQRYLEILCTISQPETKPSRAEEAGLDETAGV